MVLMLDQRGRVSSGRCLRRKQGQCRMMAACCCTLIANSVVTLGSPSTLTVCIVVFSALLEAVKEGWNPCLQGYTGEHRWGFGQHCMLPKVSTLSPTRTARA